MRLPLCSLAPALLSLVILNGCGRGTDVTAPVPAASIQTAPGGSVHGGNQPVTGATVQLWQVGTTGYGSTPSTLGAPVTSGAGGAFTLGAYTCPSSSTLVYLTATGGNPGLPSGTNNSALVMLAALGQCGSLSASTFTNINEVSTVAAVYALQQFMSASGNIGSYSSNTALANAFATVNNLINTTTGTARTVTPNGNGIVPQAEINTLANILTPCVNSTGPTSSSCSALFSAATPSGGSTPGNTLAAAIAIAQNPGQNQTPLFNQSLPNPAFQPALTSAPNDWTLGLSYSTGATQAFAIAIDSLNNIWVANSSANSVSAMTFLGVPASNSPYTSSSFNNIGGLAVDSANNVWISSFANNSAFELGLSANTITTLSGPYSNIGLNGPNSVAVDAANNIWFGNFNGNSVTELLSGGGSSNSYTGIPKPNALAIDSYGNVWSADSSNAEISEILPSTGNQYTYAGGGLSSPAALAVGSGNTLWVSDSSLAQLAEISGGGYPLSPSSGYSGGGLTSGYGVAIDGSGNIWIPDNTGNRISEFNSAGTALSPSTGFQGGSMSTPREIAIDASGNVWIANRNPAVVNSAYQTVSEFIGLAAPAHMPLVAGVRTNSIALRPGAPSIAAAVVPSATLNSAYTFSFTGSGGNGPYTWAITSGLTALQTAGLSFSSSGVLSGIPNAVNNYAFTVQLTDSGTNQTASASYVLTVLSPPQTVCSHDGSGNAVLNGNYAFLMSGFNPAGHFYDTIGDFKANGAGAITSGNADVNGDQNIALFASGEQQYTFSGTYSVGSTDNRGIMTVTNTNTAATGLPATTTYCFAADTITSGVAYSGRIIQADQSGFIQTGFFTIQNPSTFANSAVTGGYAFGMQGVATTATARRGWIGQFTSAGNGSISSGQYNISGATGTSGSLVNSYTSNTLSASTYSIASNGRGTITFNVGGTLLPFIVYTVGTGQQLYMLSANASASGTTPLLVGHAIQQTTTNFTTASIQANGVFRFAGTTNPNNAAVFDNVGVGQIIFDGAGDYSFLSDENSGGSISSPASNNGSGTYTVTSNGYVTLSGSGPHFYLWAPGAGFGVDSSTSVDAFFMLPQTVPAGGFSSANLSTYINGNYAAGTMFPSTYSAANNNPTVFALYANFTSGTTSIIQDEVGAPATAGYIVTEAVSSSSYQLDPSYGPGSGRILITNPSNGSSVVGYIISPTQSFLIQNSPGQVGLTIQGDHW